MPLELFQASRKSRDVKSLHALTRPNFDKGLILTNPPQANGWVKLVRWIN